MVSPSGTPSGATHWHPERVSSAAEAAELIAVEARGPLARRSATSCVASQD